MNYVFAIKACVLGILIMLGFLIVGCGGGSSAGPSNPGPPVQPIPVNPLTLPPVFQPLTLPQRNQIKRNYRTQMKFVNQPALALINADEAYVNLEASRGRGASDTARTPTVRPGEGIKIGVIDSGINLNRRHPALDGVSIEKQFSVSSNYSHGRAVISVIASNPQTSGLSSLDQFGGIAWGAGFKMYELALGSGGGKYVPVSLEVIKKDDLSSAGISTRISQAIRDRMDFLNLSIGYPGLIENYDKRDIQVHLDRRINILKQNNGYPDKTILIQSAGNAHGEVCDIGIQSCERSSMSFPGEGEINASSPQITAALMVHIPELQSHMVTVVSVDPTGEISDFSNRCGIAKQWCIAAPGRDVRVAVYEFNRITNRFKATTDLWRGTSFSAPLVTGGLAVMKHIFRGQLSNTALLQRLYATANKSDIYADSDIYGQGLMDLGAATSPQGSQTLSLGSTVDEGGVRLTGSRLNLGMAFGDGLRTGLMNHQIVAFDRLGAPFWHTLSDFVQPQHHSRPLSERLYRWDRSLQTRSDDGRRLSFTTAVTGVQSGDRRTSSKFQLGILQNQSAVSTGPLSLAENAVSLTYAGSNRFSMSAYTTASTRVSQPMTGLMLSWKAPKLPIALRFAGLGENASMLGSETSGAFGRVASHAIAVSAVTEFNWTGWQMRAEVEIGRSAPRVSDGVITGASDVWTSGFVVQGSRQLDRNNRITLGIAQPMRAEKGSLAISMPVGRTPAGKVLRTPLDMVLSPTGRQLDLSINWQHQVSVAEGFMLEGVYRRHPGHNVHSSFELEWTAGWRRRF